MPDTILWPFVVFFLVAILLVAAALGVAYVVGERHHQRETDVPYESGMLPTGSARVRFPAEFYLVAMFFVIFDLETVFVVSWALVARRLGWPGYISIVVFVGLLLAALVYLWRVGALDWGTSRRKQLARETEEGQANVCKS